MNKINKIERIDTEGYIYEMDSTCEFGKVQIKVEAEVGGHGCLYGIELPKMAIRGGCWSGDSKNPEMRDVLSVLNRIFDDYHTDLSICQGKTKKI